MSFSSINLHCNESWPWLPANMMESSHTFVSQLEIPKLSRCPMSQLSEEFVNRVPIDKINQSSVQFYTSDGTFLGMGVAIKGQSVLTCNHLFKNLDTSTNVSMVHQGRSYDVPLGSRICHDRLDATLFTVEGLNPEPVNFSSKSPVGGRFIVCYQSECGPCISTGDMTEHHYLSSHFQFNCDLMPGTSGSGVWNSQGELVGIHFWDEKSFVNCRRFIPISHLREFLGLKESFDSVMVPSSQDPSTIDWRPSMFPLETGNYEVYRSTDVPGVVANLINDLIHSGVFLNDIEDLLEGYLNALWDTSYLTNFPVLELHHSAIQELSKQCGSDLKNGITLKVNELKKVQEKSVEDDMAAIANRLGYHRPTQLLSKSKFLSKPPKKTQFISPDNQYILSIDIDRHAGASFKGYAKLRNKYEHIGTYKPNLEFLGHGNEGQNLSHMDVMPKYPN